MSVVTQRRAPTSPHVEVHRWPAQPGHVSYPDSAVSGVAPADFRLGGAGLPPDTIAKVHDRFLGYLAEKSATFLGYQIDLDLEYKQVFKDYSAASSGRKGSEAAARSPWHRLQRGPQARPSIRGR